MNERQWWFVQRFAHENSPESGDWFEIQLLNDDGQAAGSTRFAHGVFDVVVAGLSVPQAVIGVAERCEANQGQYVNSEGCVTDWMGNRLAGG